MTMAKRMIAAIFAIVALVSLQGVFPETARADGASGEFTAHQVVKKDSLSSMTFSYCFTAKTPDAPMPSGSVDGKYCFDLTGNETKTFHIDVSAGAPSESVYSLEMVSTVPGSVVFGWESYTYKLYVRNGAATVIAFDKNGSKVEDPVFTFDELKVSHPPTEITSPPSTKTPPPTASMPPATSFPTPPPNELVNTGAKISLGAAAILLTGGLILLMTRRNLSRHARDIK